MKKKSSVEQQTSEAKQRLHQFTNENYTFFYNICTASDGRCHSCFACQLFTKWSKTSTTFPTNCAVFFLARRPLLIWLFPSISMKRLFLSSYLSLLFLFVNSFMLVRWYFLLHIYYFFLLKCCFPSTQITSKLSNFMVKTEKKTQIILSTLNPVVISLINCRRRHFICQINVLFASLERDS